VPVETVLSGSRLELGATSSTVTMVTAAHDRQPAEISRWVGCDQLLIERLFESHAKSLAPMTNHPGALALRSRSTLNLFVVTRVQWEIGKLLL